MILFKYFGRKRKIPPVSPGRLDPMVRMGVNRGADDKSGQCLTDFSKPKRVWHNTKSSSQKRSGVIHQNATMLHTLWHVSSYFADFISQENNWITYSKIGTGSLSSIERHVGWRVRGQEESGDRMAKDDWVRKEMCIPFGLTANSFVGTTINQNSEPFSALQNHFQNHFSESSAEPVSALQDHKHTFFFIISPD